jgi:hypothetical protein
LPKISPVDSNQLIKILGHQGFNVIRQKGSHVILINNAKTRIAHHRRFYGGVNITTFLEERVKQTELLQTNRKVRLKIEKENIVIMPRISAGEFIKEMEGCIKEGAPDMDPLKLKKMWEPTEK